MSLKRRLERLEQESFQAEDREDPPEKVREIAERSIERSLREGHKLVFQIYEDGSVYTHDGRPVTDSYQTLAEEFYQWELEWYEVGSSELVFAADSEAFYTLEGELALSRTYVSLPRLMGRG